MADQNTQFMAILTAVGEAKLANAQALGIVWNITQLGVGDANGAEPTPDREQEALINERRRAPLNQLFVSPDNASIIVAEQVIPEDVGGWWIREIGLYDEAGDLVAVANCPPTFKPLLAQGSGRTQVVRLNLLVSSTQSITLKIDPSVVLATRAYCDGKVAEELAKLDHKNSVRAATTANIVLNGLQSIDGVALAVGDRVLVKDQAAGNDNGIYIAAAGAWARATDADLSVEVTPGLVVGIEQGATLADTRWQLVTDGAIVLGTTALTFQNITKGFAPLSSPAFTDNPTAPTPAQFNNSLSLMTTAFAKRMGVEFSGLNSIGASTVLTNAYVGGIVSAASAAAINVTLPPTAGVPHSAAILLTNAGTGAVTLLGSGADLTTNQSGATISIVLGQGDSAWLVKVTGEWRLISGSVSLAYAKAFLDRTKGLAAAQQVTTTPAANAAFTLTRAFSAFVAPCNGTVLALQSVNLGGTGTQPAAFTNKIKIVGSVTGQVEPGDTTVAPMTNHASLQVSKGETVTVTGTISATATNVLWSSMGISTSYVFIPTN